MDKNITTLNNDTAVDSSTTATDVTVAESSTAKSTEVSHVSEAQELDVAVAKAVETPKTESVDKEESLVQKQNTTEEKQAEEKVGDKEEPSDKKSAEGEEKKDDKKEEEVPPFHQHPRWVEKQQEVVTLKKELETAKPYIDSAKQIETYCTQNNIAPQQFQEALELTAMLNSNPKAAIERIRASIEAVEVTQGSKLPADLQSQVDEGVIPESVAKELVQLRLQTAKGQQVQKQTQEQMIQQTQNQIAQSLTSWEANKKASDVDYALKESLISDRFVALCAQKPPQNAAQAVQYAEQAYNDVKGHLSKFLPKPAVKKSLSTNGSSTTSVKEPETVDEAVDAYLARRK